MDEKLVAMKAKLQELLKESSRLAKLSKEQPELRKELVIVRERRSKLSENIRNREARLTCEECGDPNEDYSCGEKYTCCACESGSCGCGYCFTCNACDSCKGVRDGQ